MSGPTAAMNSVAKLHQAQYTGGIIYNMKFSPEALSGEENLQRLADMIKIYFSKGGGQVQFNVTSTDTLKEAQDLLTQLSGQLAEQRVVPSALLAPIFHLPSADEVRSETMLVALGSMMALDFKRAFDVARVRRRAAGAWGALTTLGGLLTTGNSELERVIDAA